MSETHILINSDDSKEGYFTFSTSNPADYRRFVRRIGGEQRLINVRVNTHKGHPVEWIMRVPISAFSRATFGIKKVSGSTGSKKEKPIIGANQ